MCMSNRQHSVSTQEMAPVIDACLHAILPFVLHHPERPADAVPWRPWPDRGNDIWSKRRYKSATFCAPWVPPRKCCEFGGCWEACWQAGELTAVSRSMLAAVKKQAKVEKTNNTANKRRRKTLATVALIFLYTDAMYETVASTWGGLGRLVLHQACHTSPFQVFQVVFGEKTAKQTGMTSLGFPGLSAHSVSGFVALFGQKTPQRTGMTSLGFPGLLSQSVLGLLI